MGFYTLPETDISMLVRMGGRLRVRKMRDFWSDLVFIETLDQLHAAGATQNPGRSYTRILQARTLLESARSQMVVLDRFRYS